MALLEEIEKEKEKIEMIMERTKFGLARTESLANSIMGNGGEEDNREATAKENNTGNLDELKAAVDELNDVASMTEEEQLAYALQMSLDETNKR